MKFATKEAYIEATEESWKELWKLVGSLTESQLTKRIRGKTGPARSARDALAHVYAWHVLMLKWYADGLDGTPDVPAKGYNWSETRKLNAALHDEHADTPLRSVVRRLKLSHGRVMKLVRSLEEEQLLCAGHFLWTKKLPLMS